VKALVAARAGTARRAARAAAGVAGRAAVGVAWDLVDADMVAWAEAEAGALVSDIDATTRAGIRQAIGETYRHGLSVGQTKRLLERQIGLTERDAALVGRRMSELL